MTGARVPARHGTGDRLRGTKAVIGGRIEKVDTFDPGPPLLRSKYEWRTRYRKYLLQEIVAYAMVLIITMSVVSAILYLVIEDAALAVLVVVLTTVCFLVAEFWSKGILGYKIAPGLYQEGLIHQKGFFLPYDEIEDLQTRKGLIPILVPDKVVFIPRFENRLVDYSEWDMEVHIIGEDGLELLRERITEVPDEDVE